MLLDKVTRCLHALHTATAKEPIGQVSSGSLAVFTTGLSNKRNWSCSNHPEWLLLEVLQRIMIRTRQHTVARQLLDNLGGPGLCQEDRGAILQVELLFNYDFHSTKLLLYSFAV